jgi:transposase
MRDELTDHEWAAIRPMMPDKPGRSAGMTAAERRQMQETPARPADSGRALRKGELYAGDDLFP